MSDSTAESSRDITSRLSDNLPRLLREFSRDYEARVNAALVKRGYGDIRSTHSHVLANLGMGAVRVTELAERARVTQQAMGKMLKELERMGYVVRDVDSRDKRARAIRLTDRGTALARDCLAAVEQVRGDYVRRIGAEELDRLEDSLRDAIGKLNLPGLAPRR